MNDMMVHEDDDEATASVFEKRLDMWNYTFSGTLLPGQEDLLKKISDAICIDIKPQKYKHHAVDSKPSRRHKLLHGEFPGYCEEMQDLRVKALTDKQTEDSLENLEKLGRNCSMFKGCPIQYTRHIITKAEMFVEGVSLYLDQQPEIREYGVTDLFAAFAAVAGLNFRNAQGVDKKKMLVLGVDVTSETDLRAYADYVTTPDRGSPKLAQGLKVLAISQAKLYPPEEAGESKWLDSLKPLSGQLLGELILEIGNSAICQQNYALAGFAVQSTKVTMCILSLPKATLGYIKSSDHDKNKYRRKAVDHGQLDWSVTFDMMNPNDRYHLWKFMMKLANK